MSYTQAQYDEERARFERSPSWELRNIVQALSSFTMLNTPQQDARLAAVKAIRRERGDRARKARA